MHAITDDYTSDKVDEYTSDKTDHDTNMVLMTLMVNWRESIYI